MFIELIFLIIINLIVMTVNHYIAISRPLRYNTLVTTRKCNMVIAVMYGSVVLYHAVYFSILAIVWKYDGDTSDSFYEWCTLTVLEYFIYHLHVLAALTVVCCCVLGAVYTYITHVVYKTRRSVTISSDTKAKRKAATVSFFVVASFIVCFCPTFLANYIEFHPVFESYTWPLFALNTVFDPMIYAIRLDRVRKGYATMLGKLASCCRRPQQSDTIEM